MANSKSKEVKGKRKNLPKLKAILANPNKDKCPTLDGSELHQLGQLLRAEIDISGLKPQNFATSTHIRLGLESSLRAINNSKCSCVLISFTIQPRFLVRLIARNVETRDATVPVYVQTQLEDFTKEIFGVRALALVLPTIEEMRVAKLDKKLIYWVKSHAKPERTNLVRVIPKQVKIKNIEASKEGNQPPVSGSQKIRVENTNEQREDFISFSDAMKVDKADPVEDEQQLAVVLRMVAKYAEKQTTPQRETKFEHVKYTPNTDEKFDDTVSCDDNDFLPEIYQPLKAHKIQPNPHKKPKKKRQKKKHKKN